MWSRALEATIELAAASLVITLLISTGAFKKANLLPYQKVKSTSVLRTIACGLCMAQIFALVIGSLTVGLKFMDQTATMGQRIGNGLLYFVPGILALAAYILSFIKNRGEKNDD